MEKCIEIILCGGITGLELLGILVGAVLVQGIVYRLTKFSIYNAFKNFIMREVR